MTHIPSLPFPNCTCGKSEHDKDCPLWFDWEKARKKAHAHAVRIAEALKAGEESARNSTTQYGCKPTTKPQEGKVEE